MPLFRLFVPFVLLLFTFAGCSTRPPRDIVPVTGFETDRYLGKWYEIARLDHRFERGLTRVSAEYTLRPDGKIDVLNRGYLAKEDRWKEAKGIAQFRGPEDVASLKVSFFRPFYGGYHVFALDPDYQWALVSGPSRSYFWILARTPTLEKDTLDSLIQKASDHGFATEKLILVDQSE